MCEILSVSRSGYYDWHGHSPSQRAVANQGLDGKIKSLYDEHKKRYGAPRITKELHAMGENCSRKRVALRMRKMGLIALAAKKFKATTNSRHNLPLYENILNRDFTTTNINQKWCSDLTYIHTNEGWLYVATVIDLHSRAVIGWSMDKTMNKDLVCDALLMALSKRKYPNNVIVHSDRGSQYCAEQYRNIIAKYNLIGSMSRKGNCWDNAVAETFFHNLKVELVHECNYDTREQAKLSIFQYIEHYYNRKRLHSALDYRTPNEVELAA